MLDEQQRALAKRARESRGVLRRLAEVRGIVGGHHAPHRRVDLETADGVRLAASFLPGPSPDAPAVVLAHGFAAHRRKPAYAFLADVLAGFVHVLSVDLRGHGQSGGACTFGDAEREDVRSAAVWLHDNGLGPIGVVGVSMGGTSAIHALAEGGLVPATLGVLVSTPAWLGQTDTAPMQRLDRMWRSPVRRAVFRAVSGVRLVAPDTWHRFPDPEEFARKVDVPLLIVHGEDDHYFDLEHARALQAAAGDGAVLWEMDGFGHAEDGFVPAFATTLGAAIVTAFDRGEFSPR